jgi:hypothetical protein
VSREIRGRVREWNEALDAGEVDRATAWDAARALADQLRVDYHVDRRSPRPKPQPIDLDALSRAARR